ncbi:MAG: hypothetical protein RLZZ524_1318 [Pseudomonadota bacterium]|jgi:hypothetical protein
MEEVEHLREDGVLVTSSRVEINGKLFAVRNIGSVSVRRPREPIVAVLAIAFGIAIMTSESGRIFGAALVLGGAAWFWQQIRMRRLVIATAGGEVVALASTNAALIERVRAAIQIAVAAR